MAVEPSKADQDWGSKRECAVCLGVGKFESKDDAPTCSSCNLLSPRAFGPGRQSSGTGPASGVSVSEVMRLGPGDWTWRLELEIGTHSWTPKKASRQISSGWGREDPKPNGPGPCITTASQNLTMDACTCSIFRNKQQLYIQTMSLRSVPTPVQKLS